MNISLPSSLRTLVFAILLSLFAPFSLLGQGTDNPTGVAGVFNGNSTTGCSYDPYTANAMRVIPDLTVAGAVGAYPLQWARILNSRNGPAGVFGQGGGWRHSYQWSCSATENSTDAPASYTAYYPDGRVVTFAANPGTPWLPPPGVTDRFGGAIGSNYVYLDLTDGGKIRFQQTATYHPPAGGDPAYYSFVIGLPDQVIDPHGLVTSLTYTSGKLTRVTEPAGRYLTISYGTNGYVSDVDTFTAAGHETQWVQYSYATQSFGGVNYVVLTGATYIGSPVPTASYTYQTSNTSTTGNPLISTCRDVRYPGPMKDIAYAFVRTSPLSYGELSKEEDANGTVVDTLTISGATRTETRGDASGASRTFTYGATLGTGGPTENYLLKTYTDFAGQLTTLAYDADGFVNSITDANGHVTSFVRLNGGFPTGVITKITHPGDGSSIQYFYTDGTGAYLDHMIDELGNTTYYKRTPGTMTVFETDYLDGGVETYTYNGFAEVLTHKTPSNGATGGSAPYAESFAYDATGLLTSHTDPISSSDGNPGAHPTKYTYDANDHVSTITDPRGNITTFDHNEIGQVTIVQHPEPDQSLIGYAYDTDGTLLLQNVQLNATVFAETDYTYDDYKRVLTVTSPIGNVTKYWYDKAGSGAGDLTHTDANVTRLVLPSGKATKTIYDPNLRKQSVTVGDGTGDDATTTYTYDLVGNLKTMKDPKGDTWTYNYDARDRLINVIDPLALDRDSLGHTVDYTYDLASNKKSEERANNQTTTYDTYDTRNRLTQMTVHQAPTADAVSHYTWTQFGKIDLFTDPRGYVYNYDYDSRNRLITTTYPTGGGTETQTYDFAGNRATFKNRAGAVQTFTYDTRNRETNYSWSTGSPQARTLVYDDASRTTSCNTASTFINFVYYNDNTLKSQEEWTSYLSDNNHHTLTYTYDVDGNRATAALAGFTTFGYTYTGRDQLETVTAGVGGANLIGYTYDLNGNPTTRAQYNNTSSTFVYDALNRVTSITHNFVGTTRTLNYAYDAVGRRTYVQRDASLADGFGYDLNDQLISFRRDGTLSGGTVSGGTLSTLNFDESGNRTSVVDGGTTTTYAAANSLNQYPTIGGAGAAYGANGNLATYNGWTYTYDSMNRLTIATNGTTSANFFYDGLNRQVLRSITAVGNKFTVWDGWNAFAEYGTGNAPTDHWLYGAGGDLVADSYIGQYYYADGLGSTSHVANLSGALLESYTYDLAGTPTFYNPSGTVLPNGSVYGINHLFTGQQWHASLGLYDLRNRFLLPSLGRFLQPDPIGFAGDPANLYRYCGNNPVNWSDPLGQDPQGNIPPGNRPGPGLPNGPVAPMPPSAVDPPYDPHLLQELPDPGVAAAFGLPEMVLYYVAKFREYGDIEPAPTPFTFTNFSNSTPTPNPVVADTRGIPTVETIIVTGQAIPSQSGTASPTGTNPAADALNSVLSRATYRDKHGLIYDENGNVIGDASNLFQFDSTNRTVPLFQLPGNMSLPTPGVTTLPTIIQP